MAKDLSILIVEDSELDARLIEAQFREHGYAPFWKRVQTAESFRLALAERSWNAVIADYSLPKFGAPAALQILQKTGMDIPFVIVSGYIGEETAVAVMKAGAHDYIMKDKLARQGLQLIRDLKPDVVTLDLRMPKTSGLELLRVLQAEKAASRVLVLDALPAEEIRNKCLALGVDVVFDKTSEFQDFLETVRRLCPPLS